MQVQQLEAAAEEALDTDSWVDCLPLVPSVLTTEDAVELLSRVPAVQQLGKSPCTAPGALCEHALLSGLPNSCCASTVCWVEGKQCLTPAAGTVQRRRTMVPDSCWMHGAGKKGGAAPRGSVLAETCVASSAFVRGLQQRALAEARRAAEEALKQRRAPQSGAGVSPAGQPVCGCARDWTSTAQPHTPPGRRVGGL